MLQYSGRFFAQVGIFYPFVPIIFLLFLLNHLRFMWKIRSKQRYIISDAVQSGSWARCMGLTATATLLLSALMATMATIPTLVRPTATTDRRGSTAASLSGPAPGIAATDMDTAACTAIAAATAMGTDVPVM